MDPKATGSKEHAQMCLHCHPPGWAELSSQDDQSIGNGEAGWESRTLGSILTWASLCFSFLEVLWHNTNHFWRERN